MIRDARETDDDDELERLERAPEGSEGGEHRADELDEEPDELDEEPDELDEEPDELDEDAFDEEPDSADGDALGLTAVGLDAAEVAEPLPPLRRVPLGEDRFSGASGFGGEPSPPLEEAAGASSPGDPDSQARDAAASEDAATGDAAADESEAGAAEQPEEAPALDGPAEIQRAIEALLFVVAEPLTVRALAEILEVGVHDVRAAVDELKYEYVAGERAFRLEEIAGGVQILTLSRYDPWLRRLREKERQSRLSAAALETLSVVAYKQPIAKADLEGIRGVDCSQMLKKLLDRGLIDIVGRDEGLGRALLYGTTPRFLESFGLGSVRDLPQPEDLLARQKDESGGAAVSESESAATAAMGAEPENALRPDGAAENPEATVLRDAADQADAP